MSLVTSTPTIRNSQFEMVMASFPVFILGWTIWRSAGVLTRSSLAKPDSVGFLGCGLDLFTRCGWDSRAPNAAGATGRVAAARQGVQTGTELRWRLAPECRYAKTDL